MTTRLITIPFSHYCEKARWALDACGVDYVEDGHLPIFVYRAVWRAGGKRTVPILVDGSTKLFDSTDIVAWADAKKPGTLLGPEDALRLEDEFDKQLGPAARRWAYFQLLPRKDLDAFVTEGVPRWEARALKLVRPLALEMIRRGLKVTPEGKAKSEAKLDALFALVDDVMSDGRKYLCGDRFSVADLTWASLAAPVVHPPRHPSKYGEMHGFSDEAQAKMDAWRATRGGQHVLNMYARHRF